MSERIITRQNSEKSARPQGGKFKAWASRHLKALKITGIVVLALAVLGGTFYGGYWFGTSQQKKSDASNDPLSKYAQEAKEARAARSISVGKVSKVSDSSIEITDSAKKVTTYKVDKDTLIYDSKGKKSEIKAVKSGDSVTITGTKQSDGSLKADRIRLQPTASKK